MDAKRMLFQQLSTRDLPDGENYLDEVSLGNAVLCDMLRRLRKSERIDDQRERIMNDDRMVITDEYREKKLGIISEKIRSCHSFLN